VHHYETGDVPVDHRDRGGTEPVGGARPELGQVPVPLDLDWEVPEVRLAPTVVPDAGDGLDVVDGGGAEPVANGVHHVILPTGPSLADGPDDPVGRERIRLATARARGRSALPTRFLATFGSATGMKPRVRSHT
jgi:hypothetical protein